jgi:uncharacterized protein
VSDTLASLYAQVPAVDCIPGCTDCCGPIPMRREEAATFGPFPLADIGNGLSLSTTPKCPNGSAGNCRVHDNRPFICRLFGTVDMAEVAGTGETRMACPHGRKPSKPLTGAKARELMTRYLTVKSDAVRQP